MPGSHDDGTDAIVAAVLDSYRAHGELEHPAGGPMPSRETVWQVVEDLLRLCFPRALEHGDPTADELAQRTGARIRGVASRLRGEIAKGLRCNDVVGVDCAGKAAAAARELLESIPAIRDALALDVEAAFRGDPAARSRAEILLAYPGLQAIAVQRLAHVLYRADVPIVPRVMTEYAHSRTGIDIHPGAQIGRRFFIDHGTGVVIGESCTIGDDVKIYQGVTLGARSFPQDGEGRAIKGTKRHPDIEDAVTIYSGATILGPVRIGRGSVIGGNVWLVHDVPPDTRIVVRTPQQVHLDRVVHDFQI
jgi:serine O-acetyltransferase